MIGLKQYRSKLKGLPSLLNYASAVEPGIYLNKDGSLTASFRFRASDIFSSTPAERNLTTKRMNDLLLKFDTGWMMHTDSIRIPIQEYPKRHQAHFVDPVSKMIDEERRTFFTAESTLYETVDIVTLTYFPLSEAGQKLVDMMFDDGYKDTKSYFEKSLEAFKGKLEIFESLSSNFMIEIEQLAIREEIDQYGTIHYFDEYLAHLNYCITGKSHPIASPKAYMYIDRYVGGQDFHTGVIPKIGDKYISILALDGLPQQSYPNILDELSQLSTEYRWSTRFIFLDNHDAIAKLKTLRGKWKQKEQSFITQIFNPESTKRDDHAVQMTSEVEQAITDANSGYVRYGYYTSNIILMHENRDVLMHNTKEMSRIIESLGFVTRTETINAVEAWLGSLPGHGVQNVRRSLMASINLSHLLPMSSSWTGNRYNSSDKFPPKSPPLMYTLSTGTTPFRLNIHVSDIGHTLIFGPTGSGKSTLLASIVAQFRRYYGSRIYSFDKGMSLYPYTKAAKGNHFDIAGEESNLSFAPLSELKNKVDQVWAEGWIQTMLELQQIQITPYHKELIHEAMELHMDQGSRSLTEFIANLQDEELRSALSHYSISGSMGHLLDAEEDSLSLSDFMVFEIEHLMNLKNEDAVPVLLYIFNRIEKSLDGRPTLLVLDEAWLMLGHPVFREKIREWLKVLRKANCSVILATQSLSDAAKSGILDVLQESCPTKIMLPNPEAFNKGTEQNFGPYDFYRQFGLNDRQIEIIAEALPKREYYYYSPYGSRLFSLALGKIMLSFVGASGKDDIYAIKELLKTHGVDEWVPHWLKQRGIDPSYYYQEIEGG